MVWLIASALAGYLWYTNAVHATKWLYCKLIPFCCCVFVPRPTSQPKRRPLFQHKILTYIYKPLPSPNTHRACDSPTLPVESYKALPPPIQKAINQRIRLHKSLFYARGFRYTDLLCRLSQAEKFGRRRITLRHETLLFR